jgi:hypothetical protein
MNHGFTLLTWVNGVPSNDSFTNAQLLTGTCGLVQGHNTGASKETGEPPIAGDAGGASIWYSWTAPANGMAMFTTLGSPFLDTLLAVYTGTSVTSLVAVVQNDDVSGGFLNNLRYSRVEFAATNGTTYKIRIDGYKGTNSVPAIGVSVLQWAFQPATNDNFASAQTIVGTNGTVTGCNTFATKETGEPNPVDNVGGHSIWYKWQAPASGLAVVDLAGSSFDTILGVYKTTNGVAAVDHLTLVGENDNKDLGFDFAFYSEVAFAATAGVTYYIAVDGFNDGAGYISDGWLVLNYHLYPPPVLKITPAGTNIVIRWDGPYSLESTPLLKQPGPSDWTPVGGTSPLTLPIDSVGNHFFRAASSHRP